MADEYIREQQTLAIYDLLLEELVLEMDVLYQSREHIALHEILNDLIDAEISDVVTAQLFKFSKEVRYINNQLTTVDKSPGDDNT